MSAAHPALPLLTYPFPTRRPSDLGYQRLGVGRLPRVRLVQRQPLLEREVLQGVGRPPLLVGRAEHPDHVLTPLEQLLEHRFAKRLLAVDDYAHPRYPRCLLASRSSICR